MSRMTRTATIFTMAYIIPATSTNRPNSKMMIELEYGDEITPVYPLLMANDWSDEYRYGEPFYVDESGLYLEWGDLPDAGIYEYGFMFNDVYGGSHYSDFILF